MKNYKAIRIRRRTGEGIASVTWSEEKAISMASKHSLLSGCISDEYCDYFICEVPAGAPNHGYRFSRFSEYLPVVITNEEPQQMKLF